MSVYISDVKYIIMSWPIEQGRLDIFRLGVLWQDDVVGLLALDIGVQVDDLDAHFKVVEQCHHLNLIGLFVDLFNLSLTEELYGNLVFYKSFIEDRVVFHFSRGEEAHHQYKVVREFWVTKENKDIFQPFDLIVIDFLNEHFQHVFEDESLEVGLEEEFFRCLQFSLHFILEGIVILNVDGLEYAESECTIEAATVTSCLPIV